MCPHVPEDSLAGFEGRVRRAAKTQNQPVLSTHPSSSALSVRVSMLFDFERVYFCGSGKSRYELWA
jgi:hypothetical protein